MIFVLFVAFVYFNENCNFKYMFGLTLYELNIIAEKKLCLLSTIWKNEFVCSDSRDFQFICNCVKDIK